MVREWYAMSFNKPSGFTIATLVLVFVFFVFLVSFASPLFQNMFTLLNTAVNDSVVYSNTTTTVTVGNVTQVVNTPVYYSTPFSFFYAVISYLTPIFTNPIYLAMLLGVSIVIVVMGTRKSGGA